MIIRERKSPLVTKLCFGRNELMKTIISSTGMTIHCFFSLRIQREQMIETAPNERSTALQSHLLSKPRPLVPSGKCRAIDNMKERWELHMQAYKDMFFESDEANLRRTQNVDKNVYGVLLAAPFYGVKINEKNNFDVLFCFNRE